MFAPGNYFKGIPCPEPESCTLLDCIFSHEPVASNGHAANANATLEAASSTKSALASHEPKDESEGPPAKKRRVDKSETKVIDPAEAKLATATPTARKGPASADIDLKLKSQKKLQSIARPVSPPPSLKRAQVSSSISSPLHSTATKGSSQDATGTPIKPPLKTAPTTPATRRAVKKESLIPRNIGKAPAPHTTRLSILKKLHEEMVKQNARLASNKSQQADAMILTPAELITLALDEEQKAATEKAAIYANVIKLQIVKIMKMKPDEWKQFILDDFAKRHFSEVLETPVSEVKKANKPFATELTVEEERAVLPQLQTPITGLADHGYVPVAPTAAEIASARAGIEASQNWEQCDRCSIRFQAFPGRRAEDGTLTTGRTCTYHPSRPFRPRGKKTDAITGAAQPYYPCCQQEVSASTGCTTSPHHVFNVKDPKRLATILQWEETPAETPGRIPKPPVTFDCEMGYTTLGLELIRITAISWPLGTLLLDVLVRPYGEILDLNSRYSGVWPEAFLSAEPYTSTSDATATPLRILPDPAAARSLLFSHLSPSTPLIGHAIDNDLNTCRIIHPVIIDTILLYPHPSGLPIRFGLKRLAAKYLERSIQEGDASAEVGKGGHDSLEDAIATGDLVRLKARDKYRELKKDGWRVEKGKLIKEGKEKEKKKNGSEEEGLAEVKQDDGDEYDIDIIV